MGLRRYFVYIMASPSQTLYVGVTNDLQRRTSEHRDSFHEGFTKRDHITKLVYFEEFDDVRRAIARETQIKGMKRNRKIWLVESMNPGWNDSADDISLYWGIDLSRLNQRRSPHWCQRERKDRGSSIKSFGMTLLFGRWKKSGNGAPASGRRLSSCPPQSACARSVAVLHPPPAPGPPSDTTRRVPCSHDSAAARPARFPVLPLP